MSATIKSYVRIRPQVATDPSSGECLTVKGSDKILMRRENENEHVVNNVFNDISSQGNLWDDVGQPALDAAMEGHHSVVFVFGEINSGKSYTLVGDDDGLVSRTMRALAGNADANLCVLLFHHDAVQDLANTANDNLKIRVDETQGASAEGSTTVRIPSAQEGSAHLEKCHTNRQALFDSGVCSQQTVTTVYLFGTGSGTVTLIDCCSSNRTLKAAPTPEEQKENNARLKAMSAAMRVWLDAAVNADPRALPWKDAKITRFLQPGLSLALEGKGFAAQVVCVKNAKESLFETMCNVSYAEACVKQEGVKTVSEYKEGIAFYEERVGENEKEKARLVAEAKSQEGNALKVKAENESKLQEIEDKKESLQARVNQIKQQCNQDLEKLKKSLEQQRKDHEKKNQEELDRMRNLAKNAPAQADADIKKKVAEIDAEHKKKVAEMNAELDRLKKETKDNKDLLEDVKDLKAQREKEEAKAMKPVREMEREIQKINQQLATAGKSREDGLSTDELVKNQPLWEARDELDDLEETITKIALECMALEHGIDNKIGEPSDDDDNDDTDDSDDDSDDNSSDDDSSDESETESEKAQRARDLAADMERQRKEEKDKIDRVAYEKEYQFFRESLKKEQFLQELVEKILCYLEYGTNVAVLSPNGFTRHFLYISKNRRNVYIVGEVADGAVPNKRNPSRVVPIETVTKIHMGQHSPVFQKYLKKLTGRVDPPRTEAPPTAEELTPNNMHRYYYRSFSLQLKKDEEWFDVVADTQTDFEAMIVAFHRLTHKDANWGKKLYIDFCEGVDQLKPFERKWCEDSHLTPQQYLQAKDKILMNEELLYVTLHDIRLLTNLDLYHAQRLLELFTAQKWVVRRQLNYFKYQEKLEESAAAAKNRLGAGGTSAAASAAAGDDLL